MKDSSMRPLPARPNEHTSSRQGETFYTSWTPSNPGIVRRDKSPDEFSRKAVKTEAKPYGTQQVEEVLEDHTTRKPHFISNWWQETVFCIVAVAALLALFATLYLYGDRPSPDWPRWLSLNTIVSIYILLLKSGVLLVAAAGIGQLKWAWFERTRPLADLATFDEASRGPLGSLALLWMLGVRHFLSSCGALIVVLALAVDPVAQQLLRYYECSVPLLDAAPSLPRTSFYAENDTFHTAALQQNIVPGIMQAINAGIFSPGGPPSADCSTGNCTWTSEYSTVGWCSSCDDITTLVSSRNQTWTKHTPHSNSTYQGWNYTTSVPGGLSCSTDGTSMGFTYAAMGPSPQDRYTGSIDFLLAENYAGTVNPTTADPWTDCGSTAAEKMWKCQGYGAARCTVNACVKTYTASMHTGKLKETLVSTSNDWGYAFGKELMPAGGLVLSMLDTTCINPDERKSLTALGYRLGPTERWIAYNMTFEFTKWPLDKIFPQSMLARKCIYAVDYAFAESMGSYLMLLLNGQVTGALASSRSKEIGLPMGQFEGPQAVQTFFNFGNVSLDSVNRTFANLSESVTTYMRYNGMANFSQPALGVAKQEKACIAVQWPWLAFPSFLVVLTIVFFAVMVLQTRPTGTRPDIWKSSALALLYHGLAGEKALPTKDVGHVRGMQVLAESTTAQLNNKYSGPARLEVQAVTL